MKERLSLALAALILVTGTTLAFERKPLAIAAITEQQNQIRADVVARSGRYKDMPEATRNELLSRQAALMSMLEGKTSSDDLTESERMEAFNTLEWIEAAINDAESERMICKRERQLGSNRMQRICKTAAQMEAEREAARRNINSGCAAGICANQ